MMHTPVTPKQKAELFDTTQKAIQRTRIAPFFRAQDFLRTRLAEQAVERLSEWGATTNLLDFGCHTGELARALEGQGLTQKILSVDSATGMVAQAVKAGHIAETVEFGNPLSSEAFDRIVSLMTLHWVNDLPKQLSLFLQALNKNGQLLVAIPGGGSFSRLRAALMEAETTLTGGVSPRLSPLPGLKDCGRLLQLTGFSDIVVDRTEINLRYNCVLDGLKDLKNMGEQAAFAYPPRTMLSPRLLEATEQIYRRDYVDPDGRLPATLEIIWLTGKR